MHLWWLVLKQKGKRLVNRFGFNDVVIVEREDEMTWHSRELIEERCQERFDRWRLSDLERSEHRFSPPRGRGQPG
jgi:hypothetical protein